MNKQLGNVSVVGLWHLGSTIAACLAQQGFKVVGIDFDENIIKNLQKGKAPLYEPGLDSLIQEQIKERHLFFSSDFSKITGAEYVIVTYDTPVDRQDRVNTSIIFQAVSALQKYLTTGSTLVVMSQIPVGTCRKIYNQLVTAVKNVEVVYNPENLRLGNAIETFLQADRQVIGIRSKQAQIRLQKFYGFFKNPLLFMSLESAEMVKHAINSYLASSISFINQITDVAEAVGADMRDVEKGMRSDSRIGAKARISPGLGFAGATLGRDVQILRKIAANYKISLPLISDIYKVNQARRQVVLNKIKANCGGKLAGKRIALFGLVYKPGTSTLRRSFALEVAKMLISRQAKVIAFDPAINNLQPELGKVSIVTDAYEAVQNCDLLVILTEWPEFAKLNYGRIKSLLKQPVIYDAKNILNREKIKKLGFKYYGTGVNNETFEF